MRIAPAPAIHAPMKNITIAVNDELFRHARICAAQRSTTVTEMVRDFLLNLKIHPENSPGDRAQSIRERLAADEYASMLRKMRICLGEDEDFDEDINTPPSPQ